MADTVLAIWKTVARSLVSKPACKMYPVKPAAFFERTRGHIEIDAAKCIVCTLCAKRCPTGAIEVSKEKNTWQIDRFRCILCNACAEGCKPNALSMANPYTGPYTEKRIETVTVTPPKPRKKPEAPPLPKDGNT